MATDIRHSDAPGSDGKTEIAVFDLDGTVIDCQSPVVTVFTLFKKGDISLSRALVAGIWGMGYKLGIKRCTEGSREKAFRSFVNEPVETADAKIEWVCRNVMASKVFDGALLEIEAHRAAGRALVLVSASFETISGFFARELGFDACVSTRMEVVDGCYTGLIEGEPVEGKRKASAFREFADERYGQGRWKLAYSYGDNYSDECVLAMAEHPVAVNPDGRLKEIAEGRGWEIRRW